MSAPTMSPNVRLVSEQRREPVLSNGVLGMLIFIITEVMIFAGMVSAFTIVRAGSTAWPPPDQPRLPLEQTAFNSAFLFLSGFLLYQAQRSFQKERSSARLPLLLAMLAGGLFVVLQGYEWISLIGQGLTMTSSTLGSFFYLIVGMHAAHACWALGLLVRAYLRHRRGWLQPSQLATAGVLWYFVVLVWPVLYWRVYL